MRWFRFAVIVMIFSVAQAGLVDVIAISNNAIKPDLLLILLVFFAIRSGTRNAIATSFLIGLAADIITIGSPMGARMISYGIFGSCLSQLHKVAAFEKMPQQGIVILIVGFMTAGLTQLLIMLRTPAGSDRLLAELIWSPIYSAIIGPFLFLPAAWWMGIKTRRMKRY